MAKKKTDKPESVTTALNRQYADIGRALQKCAGMIDTVLHSGARIRKVDREGLRNVELDCTGHSGFLVRLEMLSRGKHQRGL